MRSTEAEFVKKANSGHPARPHFTLMPDVGAPAIKQIARAHVTRAQRHDDGRRPSPRYEWPLSLKFEIPTHVPHQPQADQARTASKAVVQCRIMEARASSRTVGNTARRAVRQRRP
jgi:hypothetical protein